MTYSLNALIGRQDVFQAKGIRSVSLAQQMALAPLIDAFWKKHGLSSSLCWGNGTNAVGLKNS